MSVFCGFFANFLVLDFENSTKKHVCRLLSLPLLVLLKQSGLQGKVLV